MRISATETHDVMVTVASGRGGGQWRHPAVIRVVTIPKGVAYSRANQRGVEVLFHADVDSRYTGPRSHYRQMHMLLTDRAYEAAFAMREGYDIDRKTWDHVIEMHYMLATGRILKAA